MKSNNGYIFILTLMMIATATVIGTYIFIRGSFYVPYMHTMIQREKAKELALGGLQIAVSQLGYIKSEQTQKNQKEDQTAQAKKFLQTILPIINRWQNFPLKKNVDGIDGEIKICIVCEDGKINLNDIYDFAQHKFKGEKQSKGDWSKIMQQVFKSINGNLFPALEAFLKKQKYKLNDVTQLLTIKEFKVFQNKIFYDPPEKSSQKSAIYLTDLFTVHSSGASIEPWLFSNAMLNVLKFKEAQFGDVTNRKKQVERWLKNFKLSSNWNTDWDSTLKIMYGKELPKTIASVLNTTFDPKYFSVISYATVGKVTIRCIAIMERIKRASNGKTRYDVSLRKLYWL